MQQKTKYMWLKRVFAIAEIDFAILAVAAFVEVFLTKNEASVRYVMWTLVFAVATYLARELVIWARHKEEASRFTKVR